MNLGTMGDAKDLIHPVAEAGQAQGFVEAM